MPLADSELPACYTATSCFAKPWNKDSSWPTLRWTA
jgi:hypothetical protein